MRSLAWLVLALAWGACVLLYVRRDAPASAVRAKLRARLIEVADARKAEAARLDASAAAVDSANDAERDERRRIKRAQDSAASKLRLLEKLQQEVIANHQLFLKLVKFISPSLE